MIRYDRLWETMAARGMSQYRLIKEYHFSAGQIGRLKKNMHVSTHTLDTLCTLLNCGISDVLEYIPDQEAASVSSKELKVSPALPEAPEAPAFSEEPEASSPERSPKASLLPQASLPAPEKIKPSSGKASAKEKKSSASKEEKKGKAGKSKKGDKDKKGGKGEKKGKDGKKK